MSNSPIRRNAGRFATDTLLPQDIREVSIVVDNETRLSPGYALRFRAGSVTKEMTEFGYGTRSREAVRYDALDTALRAAEEFQAHGVVATINGKDPGVVSREVEAYWLSRTDEGHFS